MQTATLTCKLTYQADDLKKIIGDEDCPTEVSVTLDSELGRYDRSFTYPTVNKGLHELMRHIAQMNGFDIVAEVALKS